MGTPKGKTIPLHGVEDQKDAEIAAAADDYVIHRDARLTAQAQEKPAKDKLLTLMKARERESYTDPETGIKVELIHGDPDVKVTKPKSKSKDEEAA